MASARDSRQGSFLAAIFVGGMVASVSTTANRIDQLHIASRVSRQLAHIWRLPGNWLGHNWGFMCYLNPTIVWPRIHKPT